MNEIVLVVCGVTAGVSLISAIVGVSVTRGFQRKSQDTVTPPQPQRELSPPAGVTHTEESALKV